MKKYFFYNCIDINIFFYRMINKGEKYFIIGWVGRIEENKNWKGFLDIFYNLIKINFYIKLWMFIDSFLIDLS